VEKWNSGDGDKRIGIETSGYVCGLPVHPLTRKPIYCFELFSPIISFLPEVSYIHPAIAVYRNGFFNGQQDGKDRYLVFGGIIYK
jgi:hypothetical protein